MFFTHASSVIRQSVHDLTGARTTRFAVLVCWLALLVNAGVQGQSVTAQLERPTISAGESTVLQVWYNNLQPEALPAIAEVEGLTINYLANQTTRRTTINNGNQTNSIILSFEVSAAGPGKYVIPPITAQAANQTYRTTALQLTVLKADESQYKSYSFLRLSEPKSKIYQGEIVQLDILLYALNGRYDDPHYPQISNEGFTFSKPADSQARQVRQGQYIYDVYPFKTAATAVRTGNLTLGPAESKVTLRIPRRGQTRRGNDLFSRFFNSMEYDRREVDLQSEAYELQVLPVPEENRPGDYSGSVGSFRWRVDVGPTEVTVGDPITLAVSVSGQGNLDSIQLPDLAWRGFKVYPPTSKVKADDPLGIQGTKTFEQVVIPENSEIAQTPELRFCFFNPGTESFETLTHPPVSLNVRPGNAGPVEPSILAQTGPVDTNRETEDIAHIKTRPGALSVIQPPLIRRGWFLGAQSIPFLLFLTGLAWRLRKEYLERNPTLLRRQRTHAAIRENLHRLEQAAASNRNEEFYATLFHLLQLGLAERFDIPAHGITEEVLENRLRPAGADDALIQRLEELFHACAAARYAPGQSRATLRETMESLKTAMNELRQVPLSAK